MSPHTVAPSSVVWWREDRDGRLVALVVAGPAPPPIGAGAWLACFAESLAGAGGWAVVNQVALGPLPERVANQLRTPLRMPDTHDGSLCYMAADARGEILARCTVADDDDAYWQCRRAALALVGHRLGEPIVAAEPRSSGLLLARMRATGDDVALDIVPASVIGDTPVTSLPIYSVTFGVRSPGVATAWGATTDTAAVRLRARDCEAVLPGSPPARLPSAGLTLSLRRIAGTPACHVLDGELVARLPAGRPGELVARIAVALPELRLAEQLQDRWRDHVTGTPVFHAVIATSLL